MSKATITLEDGAPGVFRVDTAYEGGFQPDSHAHQHAMLLIKTINMLAERHGTDVDAQSFGSDAVMRDAVDQAMAEPLPDDLAAAVLAAIQVDAGPEQPAPEKPALIEIAPANSPVLRIDEFNG